ncbi:MULTISPECIES: 7-carboxy-7-deazaguanine synthase QueE [unclassified Prochlorococcus]|uniref:7-carboxy-7-deazaguanine synthase QueE n=1 Tax=unclassified Prochlorococcus TaxID=2627481 RepID=UPI0005338719|nr:MULTISPECIES: 7-carboxy-7-deazaguanine synthase QueE [unclassified Prochlorococcus]KGG14529.1 Queuosine Biosynthesis QueE Radical SAM [Prochlorococcus sp. MIT 0602]KGG16046.1 Queuosine Biosynthesis QueE Radical SAM [Prochlorococcus sp. MIT 0603]
MTSHLPIVETFHSLQGEGTHFGKSAFFIRIAGCEVGCLWCDTKESWSTETHKTATISELCKQTVQAQSQGAAILVITGGEPLHHNLTPLCEAIMHSTIAENKKRIPIHLETSGVYQLSGVMNWITLSPKRHLHPQESVLRACDELKIVIHQEEDLIFAEEMAQQSLIAKKSKSKDSKDSLIPHLFLQPGWNSEKGKQLTIQYIKSHPKWRLSVQAHKWLGVL